MNTCEDARIYPTNPNVVLSMERYQDLLEAELTVQVLAQTREEVDDFSFERFCNSLFPKVNPDGGER